MRKIVAHVAVSADGFLARPDGDVAWLDQAGLVGDHGLRAFYRSIDTILWGRKTFDLVRRWQAEGVPGAGFDAKVKNYLFSRQRALAPPRERRLRNVPISENSFTGMGVGAALTGLRPIVDLTIASFVYLASDQIINQAAKLRYMTGGQLRVPIVFRACAYYNVSNAAQHADRPYPFFMNVPGLKIVAPSSPADMLGLLKSAIRDDDPVIVFEDNNLWTRKERVPTDPDYLVPIGKALIRRAGSDVTIVAFAACVPKALAAAEQLEKQGVSAEVIDLRTLVPMDRETLLQSVAKTGRLVVVDNSHRTNSVASEVAAVVAEEGFESLRKPIQRVTTPAVHIPFCSVLEKALYPSAEAIAAAVERIL